MYVMSLGSDADPTRDIQMAQVIDALRQRENARGIVIVMVMIALVCAFAVTSRIVTSLHQAR